jgi:hypothetical protein
MGTIRMPPPTPNRPEKKPATRPIPISTGMRAFTAGSVG